MKDVSSCFDGCIFRETWRGLNEASNLPGICYTSPEWYEREVRQIFFKEWLCVGRAEDVSAIGDYFTTNIVGESIAIIRDENAELRALLPICRHRGAIVLSGAGNCKTITCPYHAWTYKLSGELIGTPGRHRPMGDAIDFDRREHSLLPLRLETWGGFIFVNFDRDAISLKEWLGDLPERLENYEIEKLRRTHTVLYDIDCNWKTYADNAADEYHVEFVHRAHMLQNSPYLLEVLPSGGPYDLCANPYYNATSFNGSFPMLSGLDEKQQKIAFQFHIRPNLYFVATPTSIKYSIIVPESLLKTRVSMSWCFPKETIDRPDFAEVAPREHYKKTEAIIEEDVWIVPIVQAGLASRFRPIGRLSRREEVLHNFQKYILDRVLTESEKRMH